MKKSILSTLTILCMLLAVGCKEDNVEVAGGTYHFAEEQYAFGVVDSEEWFEVAVEATLPHGEARNIGIEVVASESSAVEGVHFALESHTIKLKAESGECVVRIKGNPESFEVGEVLSLKLRLAVDERFIDDKSASECEVILQKSCPFDINAFTGYAVLTSSWCMQFMTTDSLLVFTERDAKSEDGIIIRSMFYDGFDVCLKFDSADRLNPIVEVPTALMASTGEAFGTIYGNGRLMMEQAADYQSYFSSCERFAMLYTKAYVEEFAEVGTFVSVLEWISDDEAERIMREGF